MMGDSHISRIDKLVMNFEKTEFDRQDLEKHFITSVKPFTNFSVSEILKPEFRRNVGVKCDYVHDSDSDDTQSTESLEFYSTEEIQDTQTDCWTCVVREYRSLTANGYQLSQSPQFTESSFERILPLRRNYEISSWFPVRSVIDSDVSSESSDNEVALDLRIERKKTPPKLTGTLPAWVYCTRYSDRPTAGPRTRKPRRKSRMSNKRNRTAFNASQIQQLGIEFELNPYLSETRRLRLANELGLSENSLKIWFQNQRAKTKKERVEPNPLAARLAEEGLYNHKVTVTR